MTANDILEEEQKFDRTGKDAEGTKYDMYRSDFFSFPLTLLNPNGISDYFYREKHAKSLVVLHFTAGFLRGDIASLVDEGSHVSVPFVIGRNGMIYQLFSSCYWAYHLGRGTIGGNTFNSKRSVAIEISNIGPLTRKGDELFSIYDQKYCSISEGKYYTTTSEPFRGYSYFATFTEAQYHTLNLLLTYLCDIYNIPRKFLGDDRYKIFENANLAQSYTGIASHVNYRAYGKVDIGPAFDWTRIGA